MISCCHMDARNYILDDGAGANALLAALAVSFRVSVAPGRQSCRVYLDTFDWRLHHRGLVAVQTDGVVRLEPLDGGRARALGRYVNQAPPRTANDLAPGRARDLLARALGVRALIPLVRVRTDSQVIRIRDADRRQVARLTVTTWRLARRRPEATLRVLTYLPTRGRPRAAARVRRAIETAGLAPLDDPPRAWALAATGLTPGTRTPKLDLDPAATAREATCAICRRLLATMRQNEGGVRADIDTEFLHDFRVALRRTRAALGELKAALPAPVVNEFKAAFRDLGRLTGPVRDLDVYLLAQDEIRAQVPPRLRAGLDPLFATLRAQRTEAQGALLQALTAPSYRRVLRRWAAALDPPPGRRLAASPAADVPAPAFASERIHRRWRRLIARGLAIRDDTPPAELHTLRIQAKKLRYLLEFFASFYPPRQIQDLVRHLKGLQDNLGAHNDLVVQQQRLRSVLAATAPLAETAAIEALLDGLAARQREVRRAFADVFADFAGAEVSARFEELFGPGATARGAEMEPFSATS